VSQEPILFEGTVEENIRFGKRDATFEEVENAAKVHRHSNSLSSSSHLNNTKIILLLFLFGIL
jgi:ABC-type multidrug transport system fused ATPase/permease subunit